MNNHQAVTPQEAPRITLGARTSEADKKRFDELLNKEYDRAVDELTLEMQQGEYADDEKLAMLYASLLDMIEYDYPRGDNVQDSGNVFPSGQTLDRYRSDIGGSERYLSGKYAAMLNRFGVCRDFADAFADIASRLVSPCNVVTGKTNTVKSVNGNDVEVGHAWNQVQINGITYNIDLTYGLFAADEEVKRKKHLSPNLAPADFFLVTNDALRRIGPHHDFEDSFELEGQNS